MITPLSVGILESPTLPAGWWLGLSQLQRECLRMGRGLFSHASGLSGLDSGGISPKPFQVIASSCVFTHHMNDDIVVIKHHPLSGPLPIGEMWPDIMVLLQFLHDLFGNGLEVRRTGSREDDEKISQRGNVPEVENHGLLGFTIVCIGAAVLCKSF